MNYPYGGNYQTYIPNYSPGYNAIQQTPSVQAPPPVQPMQNAANAQARSGFPCYPVTTKAQADVFQVPFDGSTTYFVDTSNGNLYSKTFDFNTGMAPLVTYVREEERVIQYATLEDINALRAEIEAMKKPGKAAKKNDPDE